MAAQAENSALQGLVLDLAANKAEAHAKLAQLKDKYEHLLRVVSHLSCHLTSLPCTTVFGKVLSTD